MTGSRSPEPPEPPDSLLPAWDAVPDDDGGGGPAGAGAARAATPRGTFGLRVRSVSEVSRAVREAVRADDGLRDVWVEGEVGRVTVSTAGHAYFTLKDARAQLQCVWFRDDRVRSVFQPRTGLQVIAHGRIDLFEPQGALQLYVDALQPSGFGDLAVRFEETKARLAAEGLFDAVRKRPLPTRPPVVAVVTSPTGAVWRDVCTVLARRWPLVRVVLVACQVQGDGAPASIVAALRRLERWIAESGDGAPGAEAPAVTILARGGGSLEDLWAFNDERVVRAVVAHPVPVVTGIGHEVDVTLADFAADVRAATPSAAAELVVPDRIEALAGVAATARRARTAVARRVADARAEIAAERRALVALEPAVQLAGSRERVGYLLDRAARVVADRLADADRTLDRLVDRFVPIVGRRMEVDRRALAVLADRAPRAVVARTATARGRLDAVAAAMTALGPQATLDRGYAIVRRSADGTIVREPGQAAPGTPLRVRVASGEFDATAGPSPAAPGVPDMLAVSPPPEDASP